MTLAADIITIHDLLTPYRLSQIIDAMTDQSVRYRLDHAARFQHQKKFSFAHDIWGNWEIRNYALYELARSLVYAAADHQKIVMREIQDMMIDVLPPGTGDYWYHSRGPGVPHQQAIFMMTPGKTVQLTVYEQGPLTGQLRDDVTVMSQIPLTINTWIEVPREHYWSVTADQEVYTSIFTAYFTKEPPDSARSLEDQLRDMVRDVPTE